MKTFEQLAQEAYHALRKKVIAAGGETPPEWEALPPSVREGCIAATQHLWAEFATFR